MEMRRREFLRLSGAFPLALVAGGAGAFLGGYNDPSEPGRGLAIAGQTIPPAATPSPAAYAMLDPRNPNNFIAPLHLPRADGGVLGILDLSSAPVTMTAGRQRLELLPAGRAICWPIRSRRMARPTSIQP